MSDKTMERKPFNWDDWKVKYCYQSDPEIPNQHCRREKGHDGPHESYTRRWADAALQAAKGS